MCLRMYGEIRIASAPHAGDRCDLRFGSGRQNQSELNEPGSGCGVGGPEQED